jgi:hypothetical protein
MAGGAVSMSAHSNHTSTASFLTAQDCSLPPLAKGGAGGFGYHRRTPSRSLHSASSGPAAFPREDSARDWKAKLLGPLPSPFQPQGHEGDHDLYPCLESGSKRTAEPSIHSYREMRWRLMAIRCQAGCLIWKPYDP